MSNNVDTVNFQELTDDFLVNRVRDHIDFHFAHLPNFYSILNDFSLRIFSSNTYSASISIPDPTEFPFTISYGHRIYVCNNEYTTLSIIANLLEFIQSDII